MNNKPLINEGERIIEKELKNDLQLHIIGVNNTCNLIAKSIEAFPEMNLDEVTSSVKVVYTLLAKVMNDLRAAAIVAARGYSIQAATLASSLYETAFMIAYIGNNNERADKWIDHEDPKKLFINVYDLTKQGLKNIDVPNFKELAEIEYEKYRQLCMVKHSNPLVQKSHVYTIEENSVVANFGPETTEQSVRVSWFAIENAINCSMIGISSFINFHLCTNATTEIVTLFKDLKELYQVLNSKAVERWGNNKPLS